ncbi:hypothetical protein AYO22_09812 [Fonsecaea multimorphosa]|nr:hypothetical protein AYO22_09812 [Fonsecaea multimorphosa]
MTSKANVLVVGTGGVGTMAVYALESGGHARVTAVLRSNYETVVAKGFSFDSVSHGKVSGWKPTAGKYPVVMRNLTLRKHLLTLMHFATVTNEVPSAEQADQPFDFIVVTTKNTPDVPPTVADLIVPAVTAGHTIIVLVQNGMNIESPVQQAFPSNMVLSGVSYIGAKEVTPGHIWQSDPDVLFIGPFVHPAISKQTGLAAAKRFVDIYNAGGKVECQLDDDVAARRWRKLIYNASYNPVCAITQMDTSRLRLAKSPIDGLVRPLMGEIITAAGAHGIELPTSLIDIMVNAEDIDEYFEPSMQQDIAKVCRVFAPNYCVLCRPGLMLTIFLF